MRPAQSRVPSPLLHHRASHRHFQLIHSTPNHLLPTCARLTLRPSILHCRRALHRTNPRDTYHMCLARVQSNLVYGFRGPVDERGSTVCSAGCLR
jgi:hypothetical protein